MNMSTSHSRSHLTNDKKRSAPNIASNSVRKIGRVANFSEDASNQCPTQKLQRPSQIIEKKASMKVSRPKNASGIKPKPKRPLSAYNIFFREERIKILASLPAAKVDDGSETGKKGKSTSRKKRNPHGKIGFENLGKQIGQNWRQLDELALGPYCKLAELDKARYRAEMKEWNLQGDTNIEFMESKLSSAMTSSGHQTESQEFSQLLASKPPGPSHFPVNCTSPNITRQHANDSELGQDQHDAAVASLNAETILMASRASILASMTRNPGRNPYSINHLESLLKSQYSNSLHHGFAQSNLAPLSSYSSESLLNPQTARDASATSEVRSLANLASFHNPVRTMGMMDSFPLSGLHGLGHLSGANHFAQTPHTSNFSYAGLSTSILESMIRSNEISDHRQYK